MLVALLSATPQPSAAANVQMSVYIYVEPTTTTLAVPAAEETTTTTSTTTLQHIDAVRSAPASLPQTTTIVDVPPVVGYAVASESGKGLITSLFDWLNGWL
jgi:hypothetical protein